MDYGQLLYKAKENERNSAKQEVRCYKSGFSPPKKLERNVSSANVRKFLARRENEEKQKIMDAQKKKEELLALRSQDKKAKRRIESMLKRTKSANYSVMEDAIDNNNTADTLSGPMQCDEDDYGYVSQEASAFYAKMMNKYNNAPAEPSPFSKTKREVKDLSAAKDRVRAALKKEEEEAEMPHKRKRKHKEDDAEKDDDKEEERSERDSYENEKRSKDKEKVEKSESVKKKPSAPPPPSFEQLLKLAEEKKNKPVDIEKLIRTSVQKEPDRPMTQKEKIEFQREQERKINRERREKGLPPLPSKCGGSNDSEKRSNEKHRIPKINGNNSKPPGESKEKVTEPPRKVNNEITKKSDIRKPLMPEKSKQQTMQKPIDKYKGNVDKPRNTSKPEARIADEDGSTLDDIDREIELLKKKRMLLAKNKAQPPLPNIKQNDKPKSTIPNKSAPPKFASDKGRVPEPSRTKPPSVPPPKHKQLSGPPKMASKYPGPSQNSSRPMKSKPNMKAKRRIDSESEYDSELDDFIADDDEADEEDYSSVIKDIFGYDKSRYAGYNDDEDECMESNFAQQMREEFVSTKIGIMEDLEDIRKEQEEKKRLKAKKNIKRR